MVPQQMQLQQIQVQSSSGLPTQTQYVNEPEHQIQNQLIQSQQIAQNGLTTSQAKASENRPIMTMVSLGSGNNNTSSPMNAMQNMNSPLSSHLTIQPPPNPLAAMTTLSYNPSNGMVTNNIAKDDKQNSSKADEQQKTNEQSAGEIINLNGTSTSSTVTNGSVTIISSSTVSAPTLNLVDKLTGNYSD